MRATLKFMHMQEKWKKLHAMHAVEDSGTRWTKATTSGPRSETEIIHSPHTTVSFFYGSWENIKQRLLLMRLNCSHGR